METRYPQLISQGTRRNHHWPIVVSDRPVEADTPHVFVGPGLITPSGSLTPRGRTRIDDAIATLAARSKARYCVVWGPHDCTYYHADGTCRSGRQPPQGDLEIDPVLLARTPLALEDCCYVELPDDCDETHICVLRQGEFVEISPGEPILVADFTTPWPDAEPPLRHLRDAEDRWTLPFALRGVTVTHADGDALYGPIQPRNGPERIILRSPWPQDVAEKLAILKETTEPGAIMSLVARRHGIGTGQLYTWRRHLLHGAMAGFVPVELASPSPPSKAGGAGRIEIRAGGGLTVSVGSVVDRAALALVLDVVRGLDH